MVAAILGIIVGGCLAPICIIGFIRGTVPTIIAKWKGSTAQGTIIDIRAKRSQYRTLYPPVVRFSTPDGQQIKYKDHGTPNRPPTRRQGHRSLRRAKAKNHGNHG